METVRVGLGERAYSIAIGAGVLDDASLVAPQVSGRRVALITNETVAPLLHARFARTLANAGGETASLILPDGEETKNWHTLQRIIDWMLGERFGRDVTVAALGGGVIGDLAGFAAAVYQRGVRYVQVPTTLLAQVDSSVGGKTGINHPLGKNLVGAFHQPGLVIADIAVLDSLPDRELRAGVAEVVKYGFALDGELVAWLESNIDRLIARDRDALIHAVRRCCELKAGVVAADERESGVRALLNFGHTFGHALEAAQGYGIWLHGEAVAAGMVMAADLSVKLGLLDRQALQRLRALLIRTGLPVSNPGIAMDRLIALMRGDKKVEGGRLRLVLLRSVGGAEVRADVSETRIAESIRSCTS